MGNLSKVELRQVDATNERAPAQSHMASRLILETPAVWTISLMHWDRFVFNGHLGEEDIVS